MFVEVLSAKISQSRSKFQRFRKTVVILIFQAQHMDNKHVVVGWCMGDESLRVLQAMEEVGQFNGNSHSEVVSTMFCPLPRQPLIVFFCR
jgi:hypothetical protein